MEVNHRKPRVLLTNDDGISSRGIKVFAQMLNRYADVTVVAPAHAQSGMSAALSLEQPLYLNHIEKKDNIDWWSFNGTPVSCVKVALNEIFDYSTDNMPDYVFSGVNIGSNCSVAAVYSGTLGACAEATLYGIPSVGFSICTHDSDCDMSGVEHFGDMILSRIFSEAYKFKEDTYLNINFPDLPASKIKGIRSGKRGKGRWIKEYAHRKNEENGAHLWMDGTFENMEPPHSSGDHNLILNGYVSIVPLSVDYTDYEEMSKIEKTLCDIIS